MSLSTDYSTSSSQANLSQLDPQNMNLEYLDADARAVLDFWFNKDNKSYWFAKNDHFDQQINDKFRKVWQAAKRGECVTWRSAEAAKDSNSSITALAG
ncbi:MAG: DUF924 family protein, partial [Psychrobacter sp.]|nr:DUF924 family protein [Psychrobacter sp.]